MKYFEKRLEWLRDNGWEVKIIMFTPAKSYYTARYEYNNDDYLKVLFTSDFKIIDTFGNDFAFDKYFGDFN